MDGNYQHRKLDECGFKFTGSKLNIRAVKCKVCVAFNKL